MNLMPCSAQKTWVCSLAFFGFGCGPLIVGLGLALVGASIYLLPKYLDKSKETKRRVSKEVHAPEPEQKQLSEFELMLASENVDELIEYSDRILGYVNNMELPDQVRSITELLQIVDRVDEIAVRRGNEFHGEPEILRLKILSSWDHVVRENGLTEPIDKLNVRKYAVGLIRNENAEVARFALFSLVLSLGDELAAKQNPDLLAVFESQGVQAAKRYLNDPAKMELLFVAIKAVTEAESDEAKKQQLLHQFGDEYLKSENELVRQIGSELHDLALLGKLDFDDLLFNMAFGDHEAIAKAKTFIAGTSTSSKYSEEILFRGIQFAESLERLGQVDECNRLIGQLEQALAIQTDTVRQAASKYFEDYHRRSQLVGKPFELSAKEFDGLTADFSDFEGKAVVVILLTELDERSLYVMNEVLELKGYMRDRLGFVCPILKPDSVPAPARRQDSEYDQAAIFQKMRVRFTHVKFVDGSSMPQLLEQCPILTAPYVLLLNPDHEVVAKNIEVKTIPGIIESSNWWNR